jgi:hypothetical protein
MDPGTRRIALTASQMPRSSETGDRPFAVVEDTAGRQPRTFGTFRIKEEAIAHARSLPKDQLCVKDLRRRGAEGTVWWKQPFAVFRDRRLFPRSLFESADLDAAMTFARSAGRCVVVIDKNEDRQVWRSPN